MATNEEPPEKDVKDFEFRQLCKFRVYPSPSTAVPVKRTQLLAVSSNFDLIFTAFSNEVKVLRFAALSQQDDGLEARERSTLILDAPCEEHFTVAALVVHIAVSSDGLTLSIVTDDDAALHLLLFDLRTFAAQTSSPAPFAQYQLSAGQGSVLKDLTWNPAYPTLLAACLSDGTVALLEAGNTVTVKSSASLPATCLSWSPKGKQIMVGKHDGSSSQYDHELKLKKDWPAPTILTEPQQATDLLWISTYTFVASYLPQSADSTSQPSVVLTVSSKEGNSNYINFDDICFGSGEIRQPKYFFQYLAQWEMVIMSSCSATETTIVAKHLDDKSQWEHWNLEDSSRAELPVTDDQADSFPVGMCVTFSSQQVLQLGDSKTHPPCPVLLLLSTDGVLVPFHMAYFHRQAPSLTAPPRPLSAQDARTPAGAQAAQAPVPSLHAASIQSSGSILVNLLSSAPTAPSPITPAAAASSGGGVTSGQQTAVRSVFGQPASVFGGTTQPALSAPSFSFAPVATATSGAPAAAKPAFSFAAQKAGGSQAPPTAAQPQSVGASVKATKPQECDALSTSATQTRPSAVAAPAIFTQTTVPRPGQPTGGHSPAAPPTLSAASMPQLAAGATPASTQGGAGDPASKLFPFGGQPSRPVAENGALLGSRPAAAPAVGGFGPTGSPGTMSGSTGSAGAGFGSTGSAGAGFGSTGSAGPGFGSTGSAGPEFGSTSSAGAGFGSTGGAGAGFGSTGSAGAVVGSTGGAGAGFGSTGNAGAGFGSTGSAGAGFGSTGSAGAGFGSTGSAGAVFGSTGSAGPGFGSTGSAGAGFGSTSGGGSGQFSFSFKPTVTSATTTSSLPPPVTSAVPAGNAEFAAQNQTRAPSLAPSTPALSSSAALAPTPASTPALAVAPIPAPVSITSGANVGASVSVAKASQTSPSNGLMAGVSSGTSRSAATSSGDGREDREIDAMLDTTIAHNIAEEIEDFESELHNLRQRMSQSGPMVGSKEEMQTLIHNTNKMAAFCKEITSITAEHSREIHDLKGSCLDLFAMAEECRCRQDCNRDPHYLKALQQRTLDPATTQRMCRLRLCAQQIAQGLNDADAVLDSQWEAHIEKEKKMRIRIPNSDTLYRAIKSNHNVLVSRQHELERVQEQLKSLQVMNQSATWDNSLSINSSRGGAEAPSAAVQPRDWRLKKADLLTPEKVSLLKESLLNHRVRKVKCQPLTSLSQSRLVSVRNEPRASSVVSSDGSIQAASNSARDGELSSLAALSVADSGAVPFLTSTPATQLPGKEAPKMMQPPTSFSGLAYFKPKPTLPDASRLLDNAGSANGMLSQPGFAFAAGPGANFKKPQMQVPCVPGFGTSFAVYPGSQPAAPVSVPALLPSMPGSLPVRYEAVTPTEFADDEAYDEEDDYAGYEEDEEDDEDEEEAGFGDQYEYPAEDDVAGGLAEGSSRTPLSSLPSSGSTAAKPSGSRVSKNLFSVPASVAVDSSTGTAALSALGAGGSRGSSGFSFAAPSSGSSLATQLSGKPLFGSTTSADHDTENKDGAGVASSSSVFGGNRGAVAASGGGLSAAKSTSPSSCTTTTTASSGFFGTKSAPSGTPSLTAASTTASKPAGGLFGFSTVPTTVAASPPGTGFFGAGATFGALSSPSASKPSATSSVFGSGSSVFGGSAGAPSFSSLLKTEVTTATTANAAGDTTVSSSGGSLFGKPASSGGSGSGSVTAPASSSTTSSAGSPFSAAGTAATSTATTGSLFGTPASTAPSMSGPPAATSMSTTTAASSVGVFAATLPTSAARASSTAAAPDTATPLPAAAAATLAPNTGSEVSSTTTAPSGGLFGSAVTAPSGGLFGSTTTAPSGGLFGSTTTTPSGGLFGSTTTTTTVPSGGLFGSTTTTTAAPSGGLFGSTATTTAAPSGGLFGSTATTTAAPSGGLFGSTTTTTAAPSGGLFGSSATTTTAPSGGLFGSATTASSGGLFGSTTTASGGLFGSTTATTTASSGSLFGSSATTTTPSSGSLFAAPLSTSAPAPFGASASTAAPSGGPLFGAPSSSAEASPFGSSVAQTSVFGSATSTTAGGSASGGASATMTTTSAPAFGFGQPSGLGGFGQPAFGSASVFGQSSPGFGQTSGSGFGQTTAGTGFASSGFGQATTTTTESSSGSAGFGGLFGGSSGGGVFGLGAKPSEEKAKQNVFGTTQAFGAAPAATNSLFGGKGPAAFGSSNSQTSNSGGSGIFGGTGSGFGTAAAGSGGVASMGFAVTQTTSNSSGGFGGGPAFGTSPSFGGSPAFGSAPSFGGSPGFGATATGGGGAFGSSAAFASPFGAGQQAPTTGGFSSFASNNTLTFGSLAQSSDTPSFGNMGQGSAGGFGALASQGGGGFGAQNAAGFGAQNAPGFGAQSPGFGSGQQQQQPSGFGNTSFGSSPSFSSYRG